MGTRRTDREGPRKTSPAPTEHPDRTAAAEPASGGTTVEPAQKVERDDASTMQQPPQRQRPRQKSATLDRSLQARIGSVLRDSFNDIEREPLPERLQDLIEELQAGEKRAKKPGAS